MELYHYAAILRRYWLTVVILPILVALISLGAALVQPPRYGTIARILVTRGVAPDDSTAGQTAAGEDSTAQDLAAIIAGMTFKRDLAEELARQGRPLDRAVVAPSISASNAQRVVTIAVATERPDDAVAIAQAAIALLQRQGLRYWGETRVNDEQPGINVGVLDPPPPPVRLNGPSAIAREVALRTLVGLLAGIGLAFLRYAYDERLRYRAQRHERVALGDRG